MRNGRRRHQKRTEHGIEVLDKTRSNGCGHSGTHGIFHEGGTNVTIKPITGGIAAFQGVLEFLAEQ
jgi:hypothetical protein